MVSSSNRSQKSTTFLNSILESVFSVLRYHPVLQNFAEYNTWRQDPHPYNQTERFAVPNLILAGKVTI